VQAEGQQEVVERQAVVLIAAGARIVVAVGVDPVVAIAGVAVVVVVVVAIAVAVVGIVVASPRAHAAVHAPLVLVVLAHLAVLAIHLTAHGDGCEARDV